VEFSSRIPCKNISGISSKRSSAKSLKAKKKKADVEYEDDEVIDPIEEAEGQER
jgi:hypothetical protein